MQKLDLTIRDYIEQVVMVKYPNKSLTRFLSTYGEDTNDWTYKNHHNTIMRDYEYHQSIRAWRGLGINSVFFIMQCMIDDFKEELSN